MMTERKLFAALALTGSTFLLACSSSSTPPAAPVDASTASPDAADASGDDGGDANEIIPGQCVFSDVIWHCGTGYGDFQACPMGTPTLGTDCTFDAGTCFVCSQGQGEMFGCVGGSWSLGSGSGTTCM
jgi:hypothetical protein